MEEHVISMEQPVSTKVERTNGETSRDHDQSIILTEDTQNQSNAVCNEEVSNLVFYFYYILAVTRVMHEKV